MLKHTLVLVGRHQADQGFHRPRLSIHAERLFAERLPFSNLPGLKVAVQEVRSISTVFPSPLPPEVAKGTTTLPEKS